MDPRERYPDIVSVEEGLFGGSLPPKGSATPRRVVSVCEWQELTGIFIEYDEARRGLRYVDRSGSVGFYFRPRKKSEIA